MGTPDFAVPPLRALIDNGYDVVGVFCQPDRPKGRGHKLAACPVKETAEAAGIPVFQPERIKRAEGVEALRGLAPDLCVTAAFGQLLSQEILDIPKLGEKLVLQDCLVIGKSAVFNDIADALFPVLCDRGKSCLVVKACGLTYLVSVSGEL